MNGEPTPAQLGYRWPAEWERHAATWMSWPHNRATWPGKFEAVAPQYAELVRAIARFEPVWMLAGGARVMAEASRYLGHLANVTLCDIETNDAWCRDHGPIFVQRPAAGSSRQQAPDADRQLAVVDWEYNAWGGKYPPYDQDNLVPGSIAGRCGWPRFAPGIVLEGGAIEGNGRGTLLTTASCVLNPNRNPHLSQRQVEQYLKDYLGVTNVLWLARGEFAGDDTDGHIDQLARFVSATTVVAAWEDDPRDENHDPLEANFAQLQRMADQDGQPLTIVRLPLPRPKFCQGQRLPASYCNFYIVNGGVIVPQFDDPRDRQAVHILQNLFPEREVLGAPSLDLVWGLGSFHCLTQQQPA